MSKYHELLGTLAVLQDDFKKFYDGGNKAAGTRIRKGLFDLIQKAQDTRKEISKIKNGKNEK